MLQEDAIRSCVWEFIKLGALKVHSAPYCPHITAKLVLPVERYDACCEPVRMQASALRLMSRVGCTNFSCMQDVSVKAVPETVVLQRPEEDVSKLLDVPAQQLLLRWVAHHIGAAGPAWEAWLPLKDMGPDLADCTALGCLLAQLEPQTASVINLRCAPTFLIDSLLHEVTASTGQRLKQGGCAVQLYACVSALFRQWLSCSLCLQLY